MIRHATFILLLPGAIGPLGVASTATGAEITLVVDPAPGRPVGHGLDQLERALRRRGVSSDRARSLDAATGRRAIVAGLSSGSGAAAGLAAGLGRELPSTAEAPYVVVPLDR